MRRLNPVRKRADSFTPVLWFALVLSLAAPACRVKGEECITNHPFPGVVCYAKTRQDPPTRLFIAEIDLTDPRVHVRVAPGGADPDGPGGWQTTLMTPTRIAAREGFGLVVNGDFFRARGVKDAEGTKSRFRSGLWASVTGPAVTDGRIWSLPNHPFPCLVVHKDGGVTIQALRVPGPGDWEVVAGNTMLVENGLPVPHRSQERHPRTAAGLDAKGTRLLLLVVDGRKPGVAVGFSYEELAAEMLRLGCRQALNLDGGGSSVMAVRDAAAGESRLLNTPSDGHERAVANVLGVSISVPRGEGAQNRTGAPPGTDTSRSDAGH